jgi:hypothetical protein
VYQQVFHVGGTALTIITLMLATVGIIPYAFTCLALFGFVQMAFAVGMSQSPGYLPLRRYLFILLHLSIIIWYWHKGYRLEAILCVVLIVGSILQRRATDDDPADETILLCGDSRHETNFYNRMFVEIVYAFLIHRPVYLRWGMSIVPVAVGLLYVLRTIIWVRYFLSGLNRRQLPVRLRDTLCALALCKRSVDAPIVVEGV